jgi:hypothetical protein
LHFEYEEKFVQPWSSAIAQHARLLRVEMIPQANHVLSDPAWIAQARSCTADWLHAHFGEA